MRDAFHLFAYGTLWDGAPALLDGCERVGTGTVQGTLYDLGDYPALVLSGEDSVPGAIWRCPTGRLPDLDRYEAVVDGLFRRAGVQVGEYACWVYLAGPRLGSRLVPDAKVDPGGPTVARRNAMRGPS
jgi:gamma-glutamylcyclotransferase (GGCT)/AIG2-like uncharacterized protein YtfP